MTNRMLKVVFFALVIKPIVLIILGLNIRSREKLPQKGPAVIAANHNSHLDTIVLLSLYPLSMIHRVRPVAAEDYFLRNRFLAWFSIHIIGIIPLSRRLHKDLDQLFKGCRDALNAGDILLLFPEGSRGQPEQMGTLKKGLYHLLQNQRDTPVTPVVIHGLGRALPKGEALLVPFNCDVIIGNPITTGDSPQSFIQELSNAYNDLFPYCLTRNTDDLDS